jgi:hypothetical protein
LPSVVAKHNEQKFVVESIVGHRANRNMRSAMEFKVRWAGFCKSCDSWEPYKALLHVDKLHDNLRVHTMPSEHKEYVLRTFFKISSVILPTKGLFPDSF